MRACVGGLWQARGRHGDAERGCAGWTGWVLRLGWAGARIHLYTLAVSCRRAGIVIGSLVQRTPGSWTGLCGFLVFGFLIFQLCFGLWVAFAFLDLSLFSFTLRALFFGRFFRACWFSPFDCVYGVVLACVGVAQGGCAGSRRDLDGPRTDAGVDTYHVGS